MSDLDELRRRIGALESAVAGVDADQSDNSAAIKATRHLVQALSITQSQHTEWLEEIRASVRVLRVEVSELRAGQQEIVRLLTQLIERG